MIHYHVTPCGGPVSERVRFLTNRHALVPFLRPDDIGVVADVCASFVLDNSAFTAWTQGTPLDVEGFTRWAEKWCRHPGMDWCLIPDIIDGSEDDNDALLRDWPSRLHHIGVPVWHLHESLGRLYDLAFNYPRVALGSSGDYATPGTESWWRRMDEAMRVVCDHDGRPMTRLHGLRMLNTRVFTRLPLASADSANASINSGAEKRFGMYVPPTRHQRAHVIASRIEHHNSAPRWGGLERDEK